MEPEKFITVLTRASYPLPGPNTEPQPKPTFPKIHFNIIFLSKPNFQACQGTSRTHFLSPHFSSAD